LPNQISTQISGKFGVIAIVASAPWVSASAPRISVRHLVLTK
jgi:hypothetical protein